MSHHVIPVSFPRPSTNPKSPCPQNLSYSLRSSGYEVLGALAEMPLLSEFCQGSSGSGVQIDGAIRLSGSTFGAVVTFSEDIKTNAVCAMTLHAEILIIKPFPMKHQ